MSMGALGKVARRGEKWLQGRFNAQQASYEAAVKWIDKGGFLGHRLQAISEMTFDENQPESVDAFLSLQAQTFEAGLVWLAAKDDPRAFNKIKAYLRSYTLFTKVKARLEYNRRMKQLVLEEVAYYPQSFGGNVNPELSQRFQEILGPEGVAEDDGMEEGMDGEEMGDAPISGDDRDMTETRINFLIEQLPTDLQNRINRFAVESLELKVQQCRRDLLRYSKLLTALSFGTKDVEPAPPIVVMKPESPPPRMSMPRVYRDSRPLVDVQRRMQQLEYYIAMQHPQAAQIEDEED